MDKKQYISYTFVSLITLICIPGTHSQKHKFVRSVLSSGFHRILQYNVTLQEVSGPTQVLITETLSKDIYLDPYQLSKRIEDNEIKIITDARINTETPAYQAHSFDIQLCSISQSNFHQIDLPIHLRYQKPHECSIFGETVPIKLGNLSIYFGSINDYVPGLKCPDSIDKDFSWTEETVVLNTHFYVPVGCTEHLYTVSILTLSVIGVSVLSLCVQLLKLNKNYI